MSLVLDIKKAYPDFSLDVRLEAAGERVALLGASGCGKAARCAASPACETPDEGRIAVNGVTFFLILRAASTCRRSSAALLFQKLSAVPQPERCR